MSNWLIRQNDHTRNWSSIACSNDGTKVIAATRADGNGGVFISTDSGLSWTNITTIGASGGSSDWQAVGCSGDGSIMAAVEDGGNVWIYNGSTWVELSDEPGSGSWTDVVLNDDGMVITICAKDGGYIWVGTADTTPGMYTTWKSTATSDIGANNDGSGNWTSVACSGNGDVIYATDNHSDGGYTGYIWKSTNLGNTWSYIVPTDSNTWSNEYGTWVGIVCSSDGSIFYACTDTSHAGSGKIYYSTNGTSATDVSNVVSTNFSSIACSGDGGTVLVTTNDVIYVATTGVNNFSNYVETNNSLQKNWSGCAIGRSTNVDGKYTTFAVANGDYIYMSTNSGVSCFVEGTCITTLIGGVEVDVKIENLKNGDMIKTVNGYKQLYAISFVTVLEKRKDVYIRCIKRNAIKENVPNKDLYLSIGHGLLFTKKDIKNFNNINLKYCTYIDGLRKLATRHCNKSELVDDDVILGSNGKINLYHVVLENIDKKRKKWDLCKWCCL